MRTQSKRGARLCRLGVGRDCPFLQEIDVGRGKQHDSNGTNVRAQPKIRFSCLSISLVLIDCAF
jgi:hypothetical protein